MLSLCLREREAASKGYQKRDVTRVLKNTSALEVPGRSLTRILVKPNPD